MPSLTDQEFARFQRFIFEAAGITLSDAKKVMVGSRLAMRLQKCQVNNYGDYFRLLASGQQPEEVQTAVDLLTTNETYFFREPNHFEFLKTQLNGLVRYSEPVRVWSAAGSTGEEAYSIAMVLEDCLQSRPWEIVASDISSRVLERARRGHYPMERARHVRRPYLQKDFLQGKAEQAN